MHPSRESSDDASGRTTHHVEHRPPEEADRVRLDLALVYDLLHDASDLAGVHPDDNIVVVVERTQRRCVERRSGCQRTNTRWYMRKTHTQNGEGVIPPPPPTILSDGERR
jgi:hypothetical protein